MCHKPLIFNGYETACRECNECVATYKNTWVARCIAQKQTLPHALCFTLTYANVNGQPPLGARVFRYKDVSDMWKRIRRAGERKFGDDFELRYVVVGEIGSNTQRCHYHGVMFSNYPMEKLGKLSSLRGDGIVYKQRLNWSIWGLGFVEFQRADRKGMSYALKYILKSRMTAERSKATHREGKTEWLASSYLWCSKVPSIGETWLWRKVFDLVATGMCPPSLRLRVPAGGDWYVRGKLQMLLCLYLREANMAYNKEHGRDLAGWKPLVASVSDELENLDTGEVLKRNPWQWLINGEDIEYEKDKLPDGPLVYDISSFESRRQAEQLEREIFERQSNQFRVAYARKAVRKCGGIRPCNDCRASLSDAQKWDIETAYQFESTLWVEQNPRRDSEESGQYRRRFEAYIWSQNRISQGCRKRGDQWYQRRFEFVRQLERARPKNVQSTSR